MSALTFQERPAAGEAEGLLVLHHGRGADENDLLGLADVLDPQRRLHVVTPRAPLAIGGGPPRAVRPPRGPRSRSAAATTGTSSRASATPTTTRSTRPMGSWPRSMTSCGTEPESA